MSKKSIRVAALSAWFVLGGILGYLTYSEASCNVKNTPRNELKSEIETIAYANSNSLDDWEMQQYLKNEGTFNSVKDTYNFKVGFK